MGNNTVATQVFQFGVGGLYGKPIAVPGSQLATPSGPQRFATIQDVDVEFSGKNVDLMGQNQFPDDVAPSDKKITFKAGFAGINIDLFNSLFFADTIVTGKKIVQPSEANTIAGGTPAGAISAAVIHSGSAGTGYVVGDKFTVSVGGSGFIGTVLTLSGSAIATFAITAGGIGYATGSGIATVTLTGVGSAAEIDITAVTTEANGSATVTNGSTFITDLGVQYAGGGYLQPVTSAPTQGEYIPRVEGVGEYVFNGDDEGAIVLISYAFSDTDGRTLQITSHVQGYGPVFEMWLLEPYQRQNGLHLLQCRCAKMSSPLKRAGYVISDFEGEAYSSSTMIGANGLPLVAEWFQVSEN